MSEMSMSFKFEEVVRRTCIEELFDAISILKQEMVLRCAVPYEPTGRQDLDSSRYEEMKSLRNFLDKLREV